MPKCKGCGSEIKWIKTEAGKNMPVNAQSVKAYILYPDLNSEQQYHMVDTYIPHWATCPQAKQFKTKGV